MHCPHCGSEDIEKDGNEYDCPHCGYFFIAVEGSKWKKAAKEHKCLNCQAVLEKGKKYYRVGLDPMRAGQEPRPGAYCNESCVGQAVFKPSD